MTIVRFEKTIIPQTLEGRKFANEYEKGLKLQKNSMFISRAEDTQTITIEGRYYFTISDEVEDGKA